jgi:membrane protein DedA with SNARE-associated domain
MNTHLTERFYFILILVAISTAGAFVNVCLNKQENFRKAVTNFLAGIVFGTLVGYICGMFFEKKWNMLISAGCSLFSKDSYDRAKKLFSKWTNKKLDP